MVGEIKSERWAASFRNPGRDDVGIRIAAHPAPRIDELLPWNWRRERLDAAA
jgi:hypothetical protein